MDKISKRDDISVGLLIGANCTKILESLNIIPSCCNGPHAFQTRLGWCIVGPVNGNNGKGMSCSQYISENGRYKWYWKTPLSSNN